MPNTIAIISVSTAREGWLKRYWDSVFLIDSVSTPVECTFQHQGTQPKLSHQFEASVVERTGVAPALLLLKDR